MRPSAAPFSRPYAFLAEKQRRSGSIRTVQSYSRMLQDFFGRAGKPPDQVHPHLVSRRARWDTARRDVEL